MAAPEKVLVAWSGGKDSALALHRARERPDLAVASLYTTFSAPHDRVSMHGVRRGLIEAQAAALEIPLHAVLVGTPDPAGPAPGFTSFPANEEYERKVGEALGKLRRGGARRVVFGDIFLEDLKTYRDRLLEGLGMSGIYPLWKRDSRELMEEALRLGFRAVAVCVDSKALDKSFVGRTVDRSFLDALPAGVDPAGENGEYHTFVFDGPIFRRPVGFERGEVARQGDFWFCDLLQGHVAI